MDLREYFHISVNKYTTLFDFEVVRPASLNKPKDNAVMFVTKEYIEFTKGLLDISNCLVFWPEGIAVPEEVMNRHLVIECENPRLSYCMFFKENNITYLPKLDEMEMKNGSFISQEAVIGENCSIFPGSYIGSEVRIGNHVYIGSGVRLQGEIHIGDYVIIRDNTVIGADGLSTDRDINGREVTMPQFGGVRIEDEVQIGANTVICRGAIDDTVIMKGSKIDSSCFISHNVILGRDTFIVGETIFFGSSSTGERVTVSGNATVRNGVHIGDDALVGMGAVVTKNVPKGAVVKGNPAR